MHECVGLGKFQVMCADEYLAVFYYNAAYRAFLLLVSLLSFLERRFHEFYVLIFHGEDYNMAARTHKNRDASS